MFSKILNRTNLRFVAIMSVAAIALIFSAGLVAAQGPGGQQGSGRGGNGRMNNQQGQMLQVDGMQSSNGMRQGGMGSNGQSMGTGYDLPPASDIPLSETAVDALIAGIQDEYHAHAVYQAVIDQFGQVTPFTRIQSAEAQHISALEAVFNRYDIAVPSPLPLEDLPQFDSVADACSLGAAAEVANFELYDNWIAQSQDYPDLVAVFTALRDASEFKHLPAFEQCAG